MTTETQLDRLCINTIRTLSMDAVQKANSGHPGTAMALAPVIHTLWDRYMRFNPANPTWLNRDRFVLSCGHASMLLYSALHINGFNLTLLQHASRVKLEHDGSAGVFTPAHEYRLLRRGEMHPRRVHIREGRDRAAQLAFQRALITRRLH